MHPGANLRQASHLRFADAVPSVDTSASEVAEGLPWLAYSAVFCLGALIANMVFIMMLARGGNTARVLCLQGEIKQKRRIQETARAARGFEAQKPKVKKRARSEAAPPSSPANITSDT
eukprot:Blabericola_migrator_1__3967@NODE_21_length_22536_cov_99_458098_g18_i0_p21_GENE_NODE_21_length_22536_cov_99_458098_g18_i0NODE_21_length_22536_cov_99_458098_g18_i0_p21_ORF_typecomplete_len118_score16_37_NODE_21_length_22536_cov_99_458098_g18_i053705723